MRKCTIAFTLGALVLASPAGAESTAAPAHLLITEIGLARAMTGGIPHNTAIWSTNLAFGDLRRVGPRTFVGGELAISFHDFQAARAGSALAIRPRVRQELGRDWAANFAAGPIVGGKEGGARLDGLGFSTVLGLDYRGYVGVSLGFDSAHYRQEFPSYDQYYGGPPIVVHTGGATARLGLRVGREPGVVTAIVGGILFMMANARGGSKWL